MPDEQKNDVEVGEIKQPQRKCSTGKLVVIAILVLAAISAVVAVVVVLVMDNNSGSGSGLGIPPSHRSSHPS